MDNNLNQAAEAYSGGARAPIANILSDVSIKAVIVITRIARVLCSAFIAFPNLS